MGSGSTYLSSVIYQSVAEIAAFLRRNDLPKLLFHLGRLLDTVHQSHAVHQADAVGIRHDGRLAKERYFIICGGVSAFGFLDFKRLSFTDNRFVFPFFPCICRKVGIVPTKIVFLLAYSDISSIFV